MEIKNEEKFSSFTESIKQLDKQGFELMSDIKLLFDEISKVENSIDDTELRSQIELLKESIENIQLQKGDKGDKGDKGEDGKDGLNGINGRDGIDGLDGKDGENGKDGSPDTPEQIVEKINTLKNVIDIEAIKDFPKIEGNDDIKRQVDTIGNQVLRLMSKQTPAPIAPNWASITGTQSDVNVGGFTNDVGYLTSTDLTGYLQNNVGIAGGTTLVGGTAIGENLTLQSTSNATKGKILFGTSAYDEVNNRLGIGQATPTARLHIQTDALGTTQTTSSGILLENATAAASGLQQISPALELKGSGWKTTATAASQTVAFRQYVLPEQNITNPTGALLFQSDVNGAGYNTRMAITTSGKVGIGTTAPPVKLSVVSGSISAIQGGGASDSTIQLRHATENIGHATALEFSFGNGNNSYVGSRIVGETASAGGGNLHFQTGSSSLGTYTTKMIILKNGNVGVGTTSPSSPLHVSSSTNSITGRFTTTGISNRVIIEAPSTGMTGISFGEAGVATRWGVGSVLSNNAAFVISKSGDLVGAGNLALEIGYNTRNMGIQLSGATAKIHIAAGSATAGTAPLKFTSGTNLTIAEAGAMEYDGSSLMFTPTGTLRSGMLMTDNTNYNTYTQLLKGAAAFTTGANNTLFGFEAGKAITTGNNNFLVGKRTGSTQTTGYNNNFFGDSAGAGTLNSGTFDSNFMGSYAGNQTTASRILSRSNAFGRYAGYDLTHDSYHANVIGEYAGSRAGVHGANMIGRYTGYDAGLVEYSNFIGYEAGRSAFGTTYANFIGYNAGYGASTSIDGIAIGTSAGRATAGAVESIFIGKNTGYNTGGVLSGDYNIVIGSESGRNLTSGGKNILIGYNLNAQSNTADGQLTIQNAIFGTGNTGTGTTASTGNIGLYVVAPSARLHLPAGTATAGTAPLKLTSGTNLTTPEDGAFEFDGTNLYFTVGGVRKTVTLV